jgi:16S rRNA (cytosine1402-N4)-methyltransferase
MNSGHVPVLLKEVLDALALKPGEVVVDGTFGGGGYARAFLQAGALVIGLDRDPAAIARGHVLAKEFPGRLTLIEARFAQMAEKITPPVDAVVLDLGVSSFQLDEAERGFSFRFDAALDMRMGGEGPTAADAVNKLSEAALADAIFHLGEDSASRRIARFIISARKEKPIATTGELAELIQRAVGGRKGARTHPATRAFQALRMLVNDELGELQRALAAAEQSLKPGGRLGVVTFHSLEDRLVKTFLNTRAGAVPGGSRYAPEGPSGPPPSFALDNRKAIAPSPEEEAANPRARSAKLRWATRTAAPAWAAQEPEIIAPLAQQEWERLA